MMNTIIAEFKSSHKSITKSLPGLVYTWNFKGAIDPHFFSQQLQQS